MYILVCYRIYFNVGESMENDVNGVERLLYLTLMEVESIPLLLTGEFVSWQHQ